MRFSAVILAGGKSSRMGRDKAWLEIEGRPLVARQIELVRRLQPAEIFLSARAEEGFAQFGCPVLRDAFAGQGPLAGIEAALSAMNASLLLVLAVDMPGMTVETLRWLTMGCEGELGVVPSVGRQLEPLAAIYPKAAHGLLRESLLAGQNAAQQFTGRCHALNLVRVLEVPPERHGDFANCNSPADWDAQSAS